MKFAESTQICGFPSWVFSKMLSHPPPETERPLKTQPCQKGKRQNSRIRITIAIQQIKPTVLFFCLLGFSEIVILLLKETGELFTFEKPEQKETKPALQLGERLPRKKFPGPPQGSRVLETHQDSVEGASCANSGYEVPFGISWCFL